MAAGGAQARARLRGGGRAGAAVPEQLHQPLQLQPRPARPSAACSCRTRLAVFFKRFFLLAAVLVLLMAVEFSDRIAAGVSEYYSLIVFALAGMLFAASANDFAMLFVSIELITITFYVLTSFQREPARLARGGREIPDPRRAVVGVHGLWHRAGVGNERTIQLHRTRRKWRRSLRTTRCSCSACC